MKDFFKFIKSSGVYFVGDMLIKMISFFLLPIYTKYISPANFGTYDVSIAYITFFCSILFLDIWNGIMRFMFDYKDNKSKNTVIYSGGAIFLISTVLYTVLILIIGIIYPIKYLTLIYLYGILMNIQFLLSYIVRGFGRSFLFAGAGLIGSIVTILTNIFLLVYLKMDYSSLYISACIGYLANILILSTCKDIKFFAGLSYFDKTIFKKLLKFAIPLCLNSAAYWFLTSYNRVIITNKLSLSDNGYYAVAAKFATVVSLFTSCFQLAWQEMSFYKSSNEGESTDEFYTAAINLYIKFLCMGILLIIPIIYVIFPYMVNKSYGGSKGVIPLYLLATVASILSSFLGSIFGAIKKTNSIFTTTLVACIVNVIIINTMIGYIGLQAANISLLSGFIINIILRIRLLNKNMKINVDFLFLALFTLLFVIVSFTFAKMNLIYNVFVLALVVIVSLIVFKKYITQVITKLRLR